MHTSTHTTTRPVTLTSARMRAHALTHASTRTQPMKRCKPCACTLSSASWHSPLPSCRCAVLLMVESKLSRPLALSFSRSPTPDTSPFPSSSHILQARARRAPFPCPVLSHLHLTSLPPHSHFFWDPLLTTAKLARTETLLPHSCLRIFCDALVRQECQRLGFELRFGLDTFNPT